MKINNYYQELLKNTINLSFFRTAINWSDYKNAFEAEDEQFKDSYILSDRNLFSKFCSEYSVFRYCDRTMAYETLKNPKNFNTNPLDFAGNISKTTTISRKKKPIETVQYSGVSKLMMLWKPEIYPPYDQYARKGLARLRTETQNKRTPESRYKKSYLDYQRDFDSSFEKFNENHGETIGTYINTCDVEIAEGYETAFKRKLFDTSLMVLGSRWIK